MTEQAAEKAGGMRGLPGLLRLLLKLCNLRPGLLERDVLDQNRLRENVNRVGIRIEAAIQECFRIRVFFLQLCRVDPLRERV